MSRSRVSSLWRNRYQKHNKYKYEVAISCHIFTQIPKVLKFTVLHLRIIFSHSEHNSDDEWPGELFCKSFYPSPLIFSSKVIDICFTEHLCSYYCKLHKINVNFKYVCYYFIQRGSGDITLLSGGGLHLHLKLLTLFFMHKHNL